MKLPIKKGWIIFICIVLFFLIGNTSKKMFVDFTGVEENYYVKRDYNFLVFSVYEYDNERYIGILFNFIRL